jgi:hypothetical protein
MKTKKTTWSWSNLYLVTFLAAYLFVFNEWLFVVTKPSYMNGMSFAQQFQIYLTISALLTGLCFLCLFPLTVLSLVPPIQRYKGFLIQLGSWLPAVIGAILILFLVDNFTYTMFKFGIVSTDGWIRGLYGLGFVVAIVLCYRRTLKALAVLGRRTRKWGTAPKWTFSLLAAVLLMSVAALVFPDRTRASSIPDGSLADASQRPHILLITADGVDANHTSLHGYARDTTPRLRELAESSLVAENAFANFFHTTGSVVSIYTGKYPAQTRFYHSPHDILDGDDSYQHLPGILHTQGYRSVQVTIPLFLEADRMNLLDGFDEVKMSSAVYSKYLNAIRKVLPSDKALFTDEIFKQVIDRIRHIFFIQKMANPYLMVNHMSVLTVDVERWEILKQEIQTAQQPVFVHVHLMVTHGKTFNPQEQRFSAGQSVLDQLPWNDDFYDDSILDFDRSLGEFVDFLTDHGLLDNTILIIGSDHGQQWDLSKRVPLVIHFPYGQHAGTIQANVENLDIAPTVLDYIGLDQPDWMRGRSLISGELEQRPVFSMATIYQEPDSSSSAVTWDESALPFDSFLVTMVHCQKWYELDLNHGSFKSGNVEGSTSVCRQGSEFTDRQAFQSIEEHLRENGYDVSSLDKYSP